MVLGSASGRHGAGDSQQTAHGGGSMQARPDLIDNVRSVPPPPAPSPLDPGRLARAKVAYTTRFVDAFRLGRGSEGFSLLAGEGVVPRSGDVVLAAVGEVGQHKRLELTTGRK